jgi:gamma-glutamyltranspeptidase
MVRTPGGSTIITSVMQRLNVYEYMSMQEAVNAPVFTINGYQKSHLNPIHSTKELLKK